VFQHNDIGGGNIISMNEDRFKLVLIDFEYSMLSFKGYDIAVLINETYIDYKYEKDPYIKVYDYKKIIKSIDVEGGEADLMCRIYLKQEYKILEKEGNYEDELPIFKLNVKKCLLLYHLLSVVWSLLMMPSEIENKERAEYFINYGKLRMDMYF
jgi:thiamine kinase-like enzyme